MHACLRTVSAAAILTALCTCPAAPQSLPPPKHCFQSDPLPSCKTFWITEFSGSVRIASNRPDGGGTLWAGEFRDDKQLRRVELYVGGRLGGRPGVVSGIAAPILAILS